MRNAARKNLRCQNCNYLLEPEFNFCPQCSQHNSNKLTSFGTLAWEVISDFFSYDSRFAKTVYPFLLRPGFLTNEFVAGRRVRYMHPLRLYLFVSIIYFSVVSLVVSNAKQKEGFIKVSTSQSPSEQDSIRALVQRRLKDKIKPAALEQADSALTLSSAKDSANPVQVSLELEIDSTSDEREKEFERYLQLINRKNITEYQVLDSLRWETNKWNLFKARQGIRLAALDGQEFLEFFLGKVSLMMFFMLPFVALFLKLLYIRRKRYYMEHLTFVLHVHAFIFLVLAITLLCDFYQQTELTAGLAALSIIVYITVAFRKVYRQGWPTTLIKIFILLISYMVSLSFFLLLTLVVSALLV